MPRSLAGSRIRQRRIGLGLGQSALARDAGISASYLNLIEHNKRRIAGRTMNAIARCLGIEVSELEEGMDSPLFTKLQFAAANAPRAKAELDRVGEFVGRFPGWASLLSGLASGLEQNQNVLARLSDRMAHDPFLSDSMHAMLSNITAIRSTASILAQSEDVPVDIQQRFHQNLHSESLRLSDTAQAMVDYFDAADVETLEDDASSGGLEGFLTTHGHHLGEIENTPDVDEALVVAEKMAGGKSVFGQETVHGKAYEFLEIYWRDARAMPLELFLQACRKEDYSPIGLARQFDQDLPAVFRRLASLPRREGGPEFGYISCDSSGSILHRKEVPGLSLPRFGGGCPIWPLYQSLTAVGLPLVQTIETPARERFWASAISYGIGKIAYGRPQTRHAAMICLPETHAHKFKLPVPQAPVMQVGPTCRLCPKKDCHTRREPSML